jgi:photosystem II stability/assembly factor-like uncharacterized protein
MKHSTTLLLILSGTFLGVTLFNAHSRAARVEPQAPPKPVAAAPQDPTSQWVQIGMGEFAPPNAIGGEGLPAHAQAGRVAQVAWAKDIDPPNQDVLWVGTSDGGLWKPVVNDGKVSRYVPLTDNFPGSKTLGSFLVHRQDSRHILIGTGSNWGDGDGIYRSDDGGATWSDNLLPLEPTRVYRLAEDAMDNHTVFAATDKGIWRSTLFGRDHTWKRVLRDVNCTDIVQDPNHPNKWYAGIKDVGVMYSVDGGDNWCTLGRGITGDIWRVSLAGSESDDRYLYALVVSSDDTINALYRFDSLSTPTQPFCSSAPWRKIFTKDDTQQADPGGEAKHTCTIVCDPNDANHVLFGLQHLLETHNATTDADERVRPTWQEIDGGHNDYNYLLFLPDVAHTLVTANDGGFYRLTPPLFTVGDVQPAYALDDSGNLLGINAFETKAKVLQGALASSRSEPDTFAAGLQDNGVIRGDLRAAQVITRIDGGDGGQTSISPDAANVLGFSSSIGGAGHRFLSLDAGASFFDIGCNLGTPGEDYPSVLIDPSPGISGPLIFSYAADPLGLPGGVYFHDLAPFVCGWQLVGPTKVLGVITHVDHTTNDQLHVLPVSIAGSFQVFAYIGPRGFLGSLPLVEITPQELGCPDKTCIHQADSRINADRSTLQPNTLYYTTGAGRPSNAFVSRDNGFSWTNITHGLGGEHPRADFNKLIGNPQNPEEFFLATSRGVFHTTNNGHKWERFDEGLRYREDVTDIVINTHGLSAPTLYIITKGRGFWMRTLRNQGLSASGQSGPQEAGD